MLIRRVISCSLIAGLALAAIAGSTVAGASTRSSAGAHDIVYVATANGAPGSEFFVSEAEANGVVNVKRCCHGTYQSSVDITTVGGTASPGEDYSSTSRTVTFTSPDGAGDLEFPIVNDSIEESLETVEIELSNASQGMTIAAGGRGVVTIVDNDGPARISFSKAGYQTFENFGTVEIILLRSGDVTAPSTIDYATSDGSAIGGSDFTNATGTVEFPAGVRTKRVNLEINNDRAQEGSESFELTLSNPVGAIVDEASFPTTQVTIEDDESASSDVSPPVSYLHQPLHRETYRARELQDILAFADDYGVGVKVVRIALRSKLTSGGCRWFSKTEKRFVRGSCNEKKWMRFRTTETVVYTLPQKLRASRGTNIDHYKVWSSGIDKLNNTETEFQVNRNVARFEIR